jgi:WD40 repeat protein
MNIKVDKAFSCTIAKDYLLCACTEGTIRCFDPNTLEHIITLPKPPPLGNANVEAGVKKIRIPANKESRFADTIAVSMDDQKKKIVALYSDRMLFIWDVKKLDKIGVYRTFLNHCGPIYDVEVLPESTKEITKFATASLDKTVRLWNFYDYNNPGKVKH